MGTAFTTEAQRIYFRGVPEEQRGERGLASSLFSFLCAFVSLWFE